MLYISAIVLLMISLFMFYELNYKKHLRKQERRQKIKEQHEALLKQLLISKNENDKKIINEENTQLNY